MGSAGSFCSPPWTHPGSNLRHDISSTQIRKTGFKAAVGGMTPPPAGVKGLAGPGKLREQL